MERKALFIIIFIVMINICFGQGTIRIVSDGSESVSPPYTTFVVPSNPAPPYPGLSYTVWGNTIRRFIDPVCWSKIIHRDGAQWISVSPTGRVSWLGSYTFKKTFTLPSLIPGRKFSRATIWLSVDDSCDIYINGTHIGTVVGFEYLHRIDFSDDAMRILNPGASNTLKLTVTNTRHSFTGVIYYMSIDYGDKVVYTDSFPCALPGFWYKSIPLKIDDTAFPDLSFVFSNYIIPKVFILSPEDGTWIMYPITTPLNGYFGDLIRRYSFMVVMKPGGKEFVKGWPIYEQRYLDLQPFIHCSHHPGWRSCWLPIGSVCCDVPFDGRVGDPDDEPDLGTWHPVDRAETLWLCGPYAYRITTWILPFKGHIAYFNDYVSPDPYEKSNAHLDISCYYFFHGGLPEVPHTTSVEPDTEIIIPPYDSVDVDTSIPPPPDTSDTSSGSPKIGAKITLLPKPLVVPHPNPFNTKTTFYYYVFEKCYAEFDIYDIYGRLVKSLYKGNVDYGNGRVEWDGTDNNGHPVASGTYIYRFRYSSGESRGTVILIK